MNENGYDSNITTAMISNMTVSGITMVTIWKMLWQRQSRKNETGTHIMRV